MCPESSGCTARVTDAGSLGGLAPPGPIPGGHCEGLLSPVYGPCPDIVVIQAHMGADRVYWISTWNLTVALSPPASWIPVTVTILVPASKLPWSESAPSVSSVSTPL